MKRLLSFSGTTDNFKETAQLIRNTAGVHGFVFPLAVYKEWHGKNKDNLDDILAFAHEKSYILCARADYDFIRTAIEHTKLCAADCEFLSDLGIPQFHITVTQQAGSSSIDMLEYDTLATGMRNVLKSILHTGPRISLVFRGNHVVDTPSGAGTFLKKLEPYSPQIAVDSGSLMEECRIDPEILFLYLQKHINAIIFPPEISADAAFDPFSFLDFIRDHDYEEAIVLQSSIRYTAQEKEYCDRYINYLLDNSAEKISGKIFEREIAEKEAKIRAAKKAALEKNSKKLFPY